MEFKDLKIGDQIYILENSGTFKKQTSYNIGTITGMSMIYDDNSSNSNPYLMAMAKKKVIDLSISCDGMTKKVTVEASKSNMTDALIGLTLSTSKDEMISQLKSQYKEYQDKITSVEFYQSEAEKCRKLLESLEDKPKENIIQQEVSINTPSEYIRVS